MTPNLNPWPYSYVLKRIQQATEEARQQGLRIVLAREAVISWRQRSRFNIPFLGEHVPAGWSEVTGWAVYVDTTGRGRPGNPTVLTQPEFFQRALEYSTRKKETYGFGVIEQGQYQVLVALYRKE